MRLLTAACDHAYSHGEYSIGMLIRNQTHFSAAFSRTGRKGPYAAYYVQIQPGGQSFVGQYCVLLFFHLQVQSLFGMVKYSNEVRWATLDSIACERMVLPSENVGSRSSKMTGTLSLWVLPRTIVCPLGSGRPSLNIV